MKMRTTLGFRGQTACGLWQASEAGDRGKKQKAVPRAVEAAAEGQAGKRDLEQLHRAEESGHRASGPAHVLRFYSGTADDVQRGRSHVYADILSTYGTGGRNAFDLLYEQVPVKAARYFSFILSRIDRIDPGELISHMIAFEETFCGGADDQRHEEGGAAEPDYDHGGYSYRLCRAAQLYRRGGAHGRHAAVGTGFLKHDTRIRR